MAGHQLLPKSKSDFASKEYWDKFFTQRKSSFEWYGEYHQLSPIFFKYAKPSDKLLVIGCGNSKMSHDLYKTGYKDLVSIDVSDVVISQMKKKHPGMDFRKMDATRLEFEDESLANVMDKGTIDALLPDLSEKSVDTVRKILDEVSRCLRFSGRFICVTLLQEQVLRVLLDYFQDARDDTTWLIRVHRCVEAENQEEGLSFPVFVFVASKMKRLPFGKCVLETMISDNRSVRHPSADALEADVKQQQNYAFLRNHLRTNVLDEEYKTELFAADGGDTQYPKYELYVVDTKSNEREKTKFACFIVPEGRETEWLFGTPEGRQISAEQCKALRVVFLHMNRHFSYGGMENVKSELSAPVLQLAPGQFRQGSRIPFLSLGEDAGHRCTVEIGQSRVSGDYTIEDVSIGREVYRRLVFLGRRSVIQTEMRVLDDCVDYGYLSSDYYKYMVAALGFFNSPGRALLLGLGGGTLASFVQKFTSWKVEAVELDSEIIGVAGRHFGLPDSIVTHQGDALDFVSKTTGKFDIIWLDIDSKDVSKSMTCPPEEFVEDKFLQDVLAKMTDRGLFVINLACRDVAMCGEVYSKLGKKFSCLKRICVPDDVNTILFASNREAKCDCKAVQSMLAKASHDNEIEGLADMFQTIDRSS